jgi:hypothetical protein
MPVVRGFPAFEQGKTMAVLTVKTAYRRVQFSRNFLILYQIHWLIMPQK